LELFSQEVKENGRPRQALNFQKRYQAFNQLINNAVALDFKN